MEAALKAGKWVGKKTSEAMAIAFASNAGAQLAKKIGKRQAVTMLWWSLMLVVLYIMIFILLRLTPCRYETFTAMSCFGTGAGMLVLWLGFSVGMYLRFKKHLPDVEAQNAEAILRQILTTEDNLRRDVAGASTYVVNEGRRTQHQSDQFHVQLFQAAAVAPGGLAPAAVNEIANAEIGPSSLKLVSNEEVNLAINQIVELQAPAGMRTMSIMQKIQMELDACMRQSVLSKEKILSRLSGETSFDLKYWSDSKKFQHCPEYEILKRVLTDVYSFQIAELISQALIDVPGLTTKELKKCIVHGKYNSSRLNELRSQSTAVEFLRVLYHVHDADAISKGFSAYASAQLATPTINPIAVLDD